MLFMFQSERTYDWLKVEVAKDNTYYDYAVKFQGDIGRISKQYYGNSLTLQWKTDHSQNYQPMTAYVDFPSQALPGQFSCPKPNGTFEDPRQCDKYHKCSNGISEERLCPDGLVFDPLSNRREPCDHSFKVDCGDRLELQATKGPTEYGLCPRLNGYYATHPFPGICDAYVKCVEGVAEMFTFSPVEWLDTNGLSNGFWKTFIHLTKIVEPCDDDIF